MASPLAGQDGWGDDTVYVGFLRYTGVANRVPLMYGPQFCDVDGWVTGEAIFVLGETNLMRVDATAGNAPDPRTLTAGMTLATVTIEGESFALPLTTVW